MAPRPTLRGYKRLPGKPRRYLTKNGVEITEYEYRSRKARRIKDAEGKPLFQNYSQQRRFRQKQEFLKARFDIRSQDPDEKVEPNSELEAALYELQRHPSFGNSGYQFNDPVRTESRYAKVLAALGMPDYYFWRYWYSETRAA
jgi:hypothetical protein